MSSVNKVPVEGHKGMYILESDDSSKPRKVMSLSQVFQSVFSSSGKAKVEQPKASTRKRCCESK